MTVPGQRAAVGFHGAMTIPGRLDVGGIVVEVSSSGDGYEVLLSSRLGSTPGIGDAELIVSVGPDAPRPPDAVPDQHLEGFEGWSRESDLWIARGDSVVHVADGAVVLGGPIGTRAELDVLDDLLQFGVAAATTRRDRLMIHGAVVAEEGDALVLVGSSGSGKSTLAAAALLGGWSLLGDDLAVVHPGERRVQAVLRPPMVPADIAARHGVSGAIEDSPRGRVRLPVEVLQPGPCRLVGVVAVAHGDSGGIEVLGGSDLGTLDDALAVPPFRAVIRRQLAPAAALVAMPIVMLRHARDPEARVARAQESLAEALEFCRTQ